MKKFLYAILLSVLMLNVGVAQNASNTQAVKDKLQTVSEKFDSIAREKGAIIDSINSKMSDTVLSVRQAGPRSIEVTYDRDNDYDSEEAIYDIIIPIVAITIPFLSVIAIVFICLLIGYKRRKAKYRIIELAIEKNYELPEYLFNEKGGSNSMTQPIAVDQSTQSKGQRAHKPNDWATMSSGIKWTAVGFGLCLFFLLAGGLPMVGICSIVLLIGLSKLAIAYNEQKYNVQRYEQRMADSQQSPAMPPPLPNEGRKDCNDVSTPEK